MEGHDLTDLIFFVFFVFSDTALQGIQKNSVFFQIPHYTHRNPNFERGRFCIDLVNGKTLKRATKDDINNFLSSVRACFYHLKIFDSFVRPH